MKTSDILKLEGINYYSKQAAIDSIKFLVNILGIKTSEGDRYIHFITFSKGVLLKPGMELYSVSIVETYVGDKLVWQIRLRCEETYSMRIGVYIDQRVKEYNDLVLTDEMVIKLNEVMV